MPVYNDNPTPFEQMRRKQGLTRQELAYLADSNINTIKGYEQRRRPFNHAPLDAALRFADALHCDVRDLMTKEDEETGD